MKYIIILIVFFSSCTESSSQSKIEKRYLILERFTTINKYGKPFHYIVVKELNSGRVDEYRGSDSLYYSVNKGDTIITYKNLHEL